MVATPVIAGEAEHTTMRTERTVLGTLAEAITRVAAARRCELEARETRDAAIARADAATRARIQAEAQLDAVVRGAVEAKLNTGRTDEGAVGGRR